MPKASASTLPALARAAASHARYRVASDALGLPERSAHWQTRGRSGFTGERPWDRTKAAGLRDGTWRAQFEDVTTAVGLSGAELRGVRSWVDAPYHRFPLLDANMRAVGCAVASLDAGGSLFAAEVLELAQPSATRPVRVVTVYPAAGQRGVPTAFNRLVESPRPFRTATTARVGYVVSVQAAGYQAMRVSRFTLARGRSGVKTYLAVRYPAVTAMRKWVDGELPPTAAMLAAQAPLRPATTYTAKMAGAVRATPQGQWTPFTRTWSFTTA